MLFQDGGPRKKAKNIKESDAGQSLSVTLSLSLSQHLIVLLTIKMQEEFAYQKSKISVIP